MECRYCITFQKVPDSLRRYDKSEEYKRKSERWCSTGGSWMRNDSPECDGFTLSKTFWCQSEGCWMNVFACMNRRRKKLCKVKCSQGKIIASKLRGVKIKTKTPEVVEPEKPTLKLRKKEPEKPTLKLRRK
jgi:hypothetical protein